MAERWSFARAQKRWFRERAVERRNEIAASGLEGLVPTLRADGPPHVVVVPHEGDDFPSFGPGLWNFYWEAAQTLREQAGEESVSVLCVHAGEPPAVWHRRLLEHIRDTQATHLLTHIESDPGSAGAVWTWDTPLSVLAASWDGVVLGVMFDSAFPWITAKSRMIAQMSERFVAVDICMPMDGILVRGRPEVGPVNMPISAQTLALVDERLSGVEKRWDISFMGAMYPYRQELIARLRAEGLNVGVNPHREDRAEDFEGSRANQPSWLDYMAGLKSSKVVINFSQSSAGPVEQLKTRVIEATLAGSVLLTDDTDRTRLFFEPDVEYVYFPDVAHLPAVASRILSNPAQLEAIALAGQSRARQLVPDSFWGGIDAGLRRRGLMALPVRQV